MCNYKIIEYSAGYFDQINQFWNENGLGGSHRGDNEKIINDTLEAGGHLVLMIDEMDTVIGTSWLTNDKRRTYIHHFGIKESCRHHGLAGELLEYCLKLANADGYQIKLEVHQDNEPAIHLYKKYGFKPLGDYTVLIKRDI